MRTKYQPAHRADRVRTASAIALAVGGTVLSGLALGAGIAAPAGAAQPNEQVCQPLDSGKIDTQGDPVSITVEAPEGSLIDGYCVKAGSLKDNRDSDNGPKDGSEGGSKDGSAEGGPVYVEVDPPVSSLTIKYPGGKAISHYSVSWVASTASTTAPATSAPATSAPATSAPATSAPGATVAGTTAPAITTPSTTSPSATTPTTATPSPTAPTTGTPSPSETLGVEPSESGSPTKVATVLGVESSRPSPSGVLPTAVNAGRGGPWPVDGGNLGLVALGLLMVGAGAVVGFGRRTRGAHEH